MKINGKAYCLFEQSGTFKNEFKKLGIDAEDFDIQNNFGETDNVIDLFAEIENAYRGGQSIFDRFTSDDFIMAFFPCIEFSCVAQMWFSLGQIDYKKWDYQRIFDYMLNKNADRSRMFELLYKFCCVCLVRGLRMVFENPYGLNTYLKQNVFLKKPDVVDMDRSKRGDYRIKPTAYWFFNCQPTSGQSFQMVESHKIKNHSQLKQSPQKGMCSEERSMISSDYARNFICDFIIGKPQENITQLQLQL